jgi:hypothetical protein
VLPVRVTLNVKAVVPAFPSFCVTSLIASAGVVGGVVTVSSTIAFCKAPLAVLVTVTSPV